jgi:periplasmic protein CpxP/Spy
MKKTTLTLSIVALAALLTAPFLFAQGFAHRRGAEGFGPFGGGKHLAKLQQKLGLSDAQVTEIKTIFADLRTQNQPYREQLKGGMQSVITTLLNNPNDTAAAQSIVNQQEQAEAAMKTNTINAASKALSVLTPDQRAQLGQLIQQWQAKRAARQH